MNSQIVAIIGDVHNHIGLAVEALSRLEKEAGRTIDQVFSVGDLGLFLEEEDWRYLTGPKKYRTPDESPRLRAAWKSWRWPLAAIGGNHEPFNRYRDWDAAFFSLRLDYTNAGELTHQIPGLRVAGLSGIYHPQHTEFVSSIERRILKLPIQVGWPQMVRLAESNQISRNRLTYYKEFEVEQMKSLGFSPHLLLLHDWPITPPHIARTYPRRPEAEIVEALRPAFVCCGHHHTSADITLGPTRMLGLNSISSPELLHKHGVNPGWCALFEWDGQELKFLNVWPE